MKISFAQYLRHLATLPEGEVVKKFRPEPRVKPPRRRPSMMNKTDDAHYMRNYMREYQQEGKGYQKVPEKVKEWRREQRKKSQINFEKEAEKWYQVFIKSPEGQAIYKKAYARFPDYNNKQSEKATDFVFEEFMPWLKKSEPKFSKEWSDYFDEISHRIKAKIREGLI